MGITENQGQPTGLRRPKSPQLQCLLAIKLTVCLTNNNIKEKSQIQHRQSADKAFTLRIKPSYLARLMAEPRKIRR